MRIRKTASPRTRRSIRANEDVQVAPEATDLLFEVEDVADLVAEVTGEEVVVEADESTAEFTVGEDVYTVEAEGDEELLEASTRARGRAIKSSTRPRTVRRSTRRR